MPKKPAASAANDPIGVWMAARGWGAFQFQHDVWQSIAQGRSGLLHANTGSGKTYAVWLGILARLIAAHAGQTAAPPCSVVWITPMRALAADTVRALQAPLNDLLPQATIGLRTGDTLSAERARQDRKLPTVLVTTPESLTLLLTRERCRDDLGAVQFVVADEWHELIGNKRGVQLQLALARLHTFSHGTLQVWGLSATLGNSEEAMHTLCGSSAVLVRGATTKKIHLDTLIPPEPGRYTWAGHLGAGMLAPVVQEIERSGTTLIFTNTRSQSEIWFQLILDAAPHLAGDLALHHGSLDKAVREYVELGLKSGKLRAVVATSSLDLGVDFLPVERVLQIGSTKGVARLLQRAGRSGHAPGRESRATLVPTNTLELIEAAAARRAALAGRVEQRVSPCAPLDVLVQHIVSVALGGGFVADDLYAEVRRAHAYRTLTREAFDWALAFCARGGESLTAYPDYHRIATDEHGVWRVPQAGVAKRHRLSIGTIVSDASMAVKWMNGNTIGHMEEGFIARLKKGDCFVFAGRLLEFVRVREMVAYVVKPTKRKGTVPTWQGGKMPLSTEMADAVLALLEEAHNGRFDEPELQAAKPMLATQLRLSKLPRPGRLLIEQLTSKEGHHVYLYPFAGRYVHMGLASLLAWRLAKAAPNTFSMSVNDYGLELMSAQAFDAQPLVDGSAMAVENLLADVLASLNSSELAQRRFREIARISGLVFQGFPGAPKSMKQVQASSGLFFEVFRKYDPGNRLLGQAEQEVLNQELDIERLSATLQHMKTCQVDAVRLAHPSPLSLPLMVERLREELSNEQLAQRLERLIAQEAAT